METSTSFGLWLRQRRRALDLTQEALAQCAGCSLSAIRKIEADERRPSRQVAELLATCLHIPDKDRPTFLKVARAELRTERLAEMSSMASPPLQPKPEQSRHYGQDESHRPAPLPTLPTRLTPFLGREPELAAITRLLTKPDCQLLTLVGPGGIGKTRLAIEAAVAQGEVFANEVYFVSLASISSVEFVVPAIADGLHLTLYGSTDSKAQLLHYLREKVMLLVLDNFEHLLDGSGLLTDILQGAPGVKLLVTSRESLHLQGEWVFEIQGLPTPPTEQVGELEAYSATALFLQSAQRAHVGFTLTTEERPAVARLCRLVEGMPLGIELAAAWVRVLSCREIVQEVERNLDFLSASRRDLPARHYSIRAVFDHSWNLLSAEEQRVLRQLSVFRGGFRREAAAEVAGASLQALAGLVDKSLVSLMVGGRYHLHELLRQFSADKLNATPAEKVATCERHSAYYCAFLHAREADLKGARQQLALADLQADQENMRLAWSWAVEHGQIEQLAQSMDSLGLFYNWRGYFQEGESAYRIQVEQLTPTASKDALTVLAKILAWQGIFNKKLGFVERASQLLQKSLALLEDSRLAGQDTRQERAFVLLQFSDILWNQGDHDKARIQLEQALAMAEAIELRQVEADILRELGSVHLSQGYFNVARTYFERALLIYRQFGDQRNIGVTLRNLGVALERQGKYSEAIIYYEQAWSISREVGYKHGEAGTLISLGFINLGQGDYMLAQSYFEQALQLNQELGNQQGEGHSFLSLGLVSSYQGEYLDSRAYFNQALSISRELGLWRLECMALIYLGVLFRYSREYKLAQEYSQQALNIAQTSGDRSNQGYALTHLGHALSEHGLLAEAATIYRQALALRRELEQPQLSMEPLAGLARISLAQEKLFEAQAYVEEILSHLESQTLYSTDEPFWIYLSCYRVLQAAQDARAQIILDRAYNLLQEWAAKIDNEARKHSFLENVAIHRDIVAEWVKLKI